MEGTNIAKLVASLGFQIEDKQLTSFLTKVQETVTVMKTMRAEAASKIQFKIGLDKTQFTAAKGQITGLGKTKVNLTNIGVGANTLAEIRHQIRSAMGAKLPIEVNVKDANATLYAWAKRTNDKFKLNIKAQVSKRALAQSLREAAKYATDAVGTLKLKDPKVKVGIDKDHLRTEIQNALAHIQQEVRIKIDLNPGPIPRGGSGGNGGGNGSNGRNGLIAGAGAGAMAGSMEHARALVPGLGMAWGVGQISKISQDLAGIDMALKTVSETDTGFDSNRKFLDTMGEEMGKTLRDIAPQFTSILASSREALGDEGTQDMFRGIMKYGTVMNINPESMKGALRAVGQMFGKDKIQAEEAQGQFAEHMPGGMQLLAKAYGKSVPELRIAMEKGALDPKVILPEMAKIMEAIVSKNDAYNESLKTSRVAQGRFNFHLERAIKLIAASGYDRSMFQFWDEMRELMISVQKGTDGLARAFQILMTPIIAVIRLASKLIDYWPKIADALGMTSEKLGVFAAILTGLFFPLTRWLTLLSLAAVALDDLTTYLAGGESAIGEWMKGLSPENQKMLEDLGHSLVRLGEALIGLGGTIVSGWVGIFELLQKSGFDGLVIQSITGFANAISALAEALIALGKADMSKLKELGNAFGWMSMKALGGDDDTWSKLTNSGQFSPEAIEQQRKQALLEAGLRARQERRARGLSPDESVPTVDTVDTGNRNDDVPFAPNAVRPVSVQPVKETTQPQKAPVAIHVANLNLTGVPDVKAFADQMQNYGLSAYPADN